jgi:ligand-binding sensor domain-containing protein
MRNKQTIKKGLLWLACLFILASSLEAQSELDLKTTILKSEAPALRFENIGISEGMKQQSATDIIQDSKGFIWIGTQQGLHRYDGLEFKVYQPTAFDTTSLSDTFILGMAEAKNGDIWVSTDNGGLNRLDQATGTFKKYRSNPNDSTSISSNTTIKPFEDSKGNLWVGTFDSGLNRMRAGQDGLFDHIVNVEGDTTSLSNNRVFFVDEDAEGFIWVGTLNGLNRIHPETDEITRFLYEPGQRRAINAVTGIYFPPNETNFYWLVTGAGLVKFYIESENYEIYEITATEGGAFNRLNVLTKIVPDPENPTVLWVSGPGTGLARFDMNSNEFTSYRSDPKDPTSLSNDIVESLFLDKSGTIWAGTSVGGINTFNPGAVNFTHLKNDPTNEQSIAPGLIWSVYEDKNGTLWIGSNSGFTGDFLTEYDINTGKSTRYERIVGDSTSVVFGTIRAFAEDQDGNLWIGSSGALTKLNRTTKKARRYTHPQTPEEFRRNDITKIIPTLEDSSIFLIASYGGLDQFDTKTGKFNHISLALEDSSSNSSLLVFEIHQSSDRSLWLGTNQGLLHVSATGKTSLASKYSPTDTLSINNNLIFSITQRVGEPNVLWLGMDNGGLNRFDITTKTANHYTEQD